MIAFDSYAWFEYFFATAKGEKVREYVENKHELIATPAHVFYEVKNKLIRENKPFKQWIEFMRARSIAEPLTAEMALKAVDLRQQFSLKTTDAFIYATALAKKIKLLSGDEHFKNLPEVEYLE